MTLRGSFKADTTLIPWCAVDLSGQMDSGFHDLYVYGQTDP